MSFEQIAYYLGAGFIGLLITMAVFSLKDLYRRLRKVEDSREESDKKIIAIELNINNNTKTLDSMAINLQTLTNRCLAHQITERK